ncbi:MAG: type II toxin-antitoxin system RatA family toxin [Pseudomonadota bacterium]|nr:type II toxin-antitoxin system RatA family toxin [Pseudomonadota bacterium]
MNRISKSAIVSYSPQQMFELVNNINDYSQFLNWCDSSSILNESGNQITASVQINKNGFKQKFTTLNTLTPYKSIEMILLDGPFDELYGEWRFESLGDSAAKVYLDLEFSFKSVISNMTISPLFKSIANSQLDAFVERARHIYG